MIASLAVSSYLPPVLALCAAFLFALSAHIQNIGLEKLNTRHTSLVLVATTGAIYWAFAPFYVSLGDWLTGSAVLFALAGILRPTISLSLWVEGIRRLGPTLNAGLTAGGPVFAAIFAIVLLGETLTLPIAIGIVLVVAGVLVTALRPKGIATSWPLWAILLPLGASSVRAGAHAIIKLGYEGVPNPAFAALVATTVSFVLLSARFAAAGERFDGDVSRYRFVILAGVISAFAIYLLNVALQLGQMIAIVPLLASSPVFSALLGYYVFGRETIDWRTLATIALVVPGVVIVVTNAGT